VAKYLDQSQGRSRWLALDLFRTLNPLGRDVEHPGEDGLGHSALSRIFVSSSAWISGGRSGISRVVVFKVISPLAWRIASLRPVFSRSNNSLRPLGDFMNSPFRTLDVESSLVKPLRDARRTRAFTYLGSSSISTS
jgi:hypothetical protein